MCPLRQAGGKPVQQAREPTAHGNLSVYPGARGTFVATLLEPDLDGAEIRSMLMDVPTDERASFEYRISSRRFSAVANSLIQRGVGLSGDAAIGSLALEQASIQIMKSLRFAFTLEPLSHPFDLEYIVEDYSFDSVPRPPGGITSLVINTLQLEIDRWGQVLYVWGLCPSVAWRDTDLEPPSSSPGRLTVLLEQITPGVSVGVTEDSYEWSAYFNRSTGWVSLQHPSASLDTCTTVEFASHCVAMLAGERLVAIWLQPQFQLHGELISPYDLIKS